MSNEENKAARIARQSQMERSLEYYKLRGLQPTVEDVVLTSHILHKYIMDGWSKDLQQMLGKLDNHIEGRY